MVSRCKPLLVIFYCSAAFALPLFLTGRLAADPWEPARLSEHSKTVIGEFCHANGLVLRRGDEFGSFSSSFAPDPTGVGRCEFE